MSIQPYPLSQLGALADKQTIACVAGTITNLWKSKTGENANGPWSIQNATLRSPEGIEIGLWIKDREELTMASKGKYVVLTAKAGDKGLSGIYVMDDDYNGKITRKIKVTPTAELAFSEPQQQRAAAPPQSRQQAAEESWNQGNQGNQGNQDSHQPPADMGYQTAEPPAQQPKQHRRPDAADGVNEARKTVMAIANFHLMCAKAVWQYEAPAFKRATGQDMTESMIQGAIASLFIEGCRSALHRNMPTGPME